MFRKLFKFFKEFFSKEDIMTFQNLERDSFKKKNNEELNQFL